MAQCLMLNFSAHLSDPGSMIEAYNAGRIMVWRDGNEDEACLDMFLEDVRCFFAEVHCGMLGITDVGACRLFTNTFPR